MNAHGRGSGTVRSRSAMASASRRAFSLAPDHRSWCEQASANLVSLSAFVVILCRGAFLPKPLITDPDRSPGVLRFVVPRPLRRPADGMWRSHGECRRRTGNHSKNGTPEA